jgi:hypothetical protein
MDVVIRYIDRAVCLDKLEEIGVTVNREATRTEDEIGVVNTPSILDVNGNESFCIRLTQDQADLLPTVIEAPVFVVDWRSDEADNDGATFAWPEAEVQTYDIDGNPDGTRMQGVGRIA